MKGSSVFKIIALVLVIFFAALYFSGLTGYYQYSENRKTTLTEDAIKRFENDLENGKEIEAKNYLQEEKEYNNKASTLGMKISGLIEKGFNKTMNSLFNEISKAVNDS